MNIPIEHNYAKEEKLHPQAVEQEEQIEEFQKEDHLLSLRDTNNKDHPDMEVKNRQGRCFA